MLPLIMAFPTPGSSFRGNKQSLPRKICVVCGRVMTWRKRWMHTWETVKYCSDACRRHGAPASRP